MGERWRIMMRETGSKRLQSQLIFQKIFENFICLTSFGGILHPLLTLCRRGCTKSTQHIVKKFITRLVGLHVSNLSYNLLTCCLFTHYIMINCIHLCGSRCFERVKVSSIEKLEISFSPRL